MSQIEADGDPSTQNRHGPDPPFHSTLLSTTSESEATAIATRFFCSAKKKYPDLLTNVPSEEHLPREFQSHMLRRIGVQRADAGGSTTEDIQIARGAADKTKFPLFAYLTYINTPTAKAQVSHWMRCSDRPFIV